MDSVIVYICTVHFSDVTLMLRDVKEPAKICIHADFMLKIRQMWICCEIKISTS